MSFHKSGAPQKEKAEMSFPVGFKCVELNIMELDEILKNFTKKYRHILNFDKVPSWKFPHKSIESLEVSAIIEEYYSRSLPHQSLYTELMEIFVDRLVFALLGIHQFLSSSSMGHSQNKSCESSSSSFSPNVSHHQYGQGDCGGSVEGTVDNHQALLTTLWDPSSVTKLSSDTTGDSKPPIQIMVNVGEILKQIHSVLNSEKVQQLQAKTSLSSSASSPPVDHQQKSNHDLLGYLVMQNEPCTIPDKKESLSTDPSQSKSSQTELGSLEGCESCWLCQNLLKVIALHVDSCWTGLYKGDQVTGDVEGCSKIRKVRAELKTNIWDYSQRGVIGRWCEALQADTLAIKEKALELANLHSQKDESLEELRKSSLIESKRMTLVIEDLELKLKVVENDLNAERKGKKGWIKQRDNLLARAKELQSQFRAKSKECECLKMNDKRLNERIQRLEESLVVEESAHAKSSKEVAELKKQLDSELEEKGSVERKVEEFASQLEIKEQEIQGLEKENKSLKVEKAEVQALEKALEEYKTKAEEMESSHKLLAKMQERYTREIKTLKEELEVSESKVELLTLFPDLNGPINPPSDDASNPVRTMELQVRSNLLRVEVLKSQSERLTNAMNKIKSKLNL